MGDEWNVGIFANDEALEWLANIIRTNQTASIFRALVEVAKLHPNGYPQSPDCEKALVAAELVAAARGMASKDMPDMATAWLKKSNFVAGNEVVQMALKVVKQIGAKSELKEIWDGTTQSRAWYQELYDLQKRLQDSTDMDGSVFHDKSKVQAIDADQVFAEALSLTSSGRHNEAISRYEEVIETKPDMALAYLGKGTSHLKLGEYQQAADDISRCLRLTPDTPEALFLRSEALVKLAKYESAVDDLDKLIRATPGKPDLFLRRGTALKKMSHFQNAVDDFTKSIELGLDSDEVYENRAECYEKLGKDDLAKKDRSLVGKKS